MPTIMQKTNLRASRFTAALKDLYFFSLITNSSQRIIVYENVFFMNIQSNLF